MSASCWTRSCSPGFPVLILELLHLLPELVSGWQIANTTNFFAICGYLWAFYALLLKSVVLLAEHQRLPKIWLWLSHATMVQLAFITKTEHSPKVCFLVGSQSKTQGLTAKLLY